MSFSNLVTISCVVGILFGTVASGSHFFELRNIIDGNDNLSNLKEIDESSLNLRQISPKCGGWLAECVDNLDCCSNFCTPQGCHCSEARQPCLVRSDCCKDFTNDPPEDYFCYKRRCDKQGKFGRYPDD